MNSANLEVRDVIRGTTEILAKSADAVGLYVLGMGALGTGLDVFGGESGSSMPYSIASVVAGYFLLLAMLRNADVDVAVEQGQRLGAYFVLSLLTGLAMLLGFVLLVIPGVILIIRWLPAPAILLAEDTGVIEAMSESWDRTRGQFWPLLAVSSIMLGLFAVAALAYASSELQLGIPQAASFAFGNAMLAFCSAAWTAVSISAYRLVSADRQDMTEVFA